VAESEALDFDEPIGERRPAGAVSISVPVKLFTRAL